MKKILLSTLFMASVFTLTLTLSSNANGPGGNRTGSPGSSGNCGSCHGGGNFNGSLKAGIVEIGDTNFITTYTPNKVYEFYVNSKGTSTKKGFQATILKSDQSAAGTLAATAPTGTNTYSSGTKKIWGHTTPSATGVWRMQWTAPAAGSGDLIVYSASVLANSNGNDNGDQAITTSKTITEAVAGQENIQKPKIKLLGNPVIKQVVISENALYMAIWNNAGQIVSKSYNSNICDVSKLAAGTYFLQILSTDHSNQSYVIDVK